MTTGAYISGVGHGLLILVMLFGGLFSRDPEPPEIVADVTVISEAEYAALVLPGSAPQVEEVADAPAPPPAGEAAPATAAEEQPPAIATPLPAEEPEAPEPPVEVETPAPPPPPLAEITETEPEIQAPPTLDSGVEPPRDATPPPAPVVAPEPTPPSEPEVAEAPEAVQETAPEPEAEVVVEEQDAAAPEETTTEIVTEAEEPKELAPQASIRPKARPTRPERVAEQPKAPPEPEPAPKADPIADAVAAAVAEAVSAPEPAPGPVGPPLSFGEKEALRVAVSRCWSVDVGSQSADVTITVAVTMNRDGTVANNQVRQISAQGGDTAAQRTAFERARRAILRCQSGGFPLPADKYAHWQEIEMTFNPNGMRLK